MEKNQLNQVRSQFKKNLTNSGWLSVLEPFIDSERFDTLINRLEEAQNKGGLTPELKDIFRLFYECPYDKLKVVITLQDPYPKEGVANGIALCCGKTEIIEDDLATIFEEIQNTVYKDEGSWYMWREELARWSKQGILMLNATLTTTPGKTGSHYDIWKPFTGFLFSRLAELNSDLVYIVIGNVDENIPDTNKLSCPHPNTASRESDEWQSNNVFIKTNEILEETNRTKIIW